MAHKWHVAASFAWEVCGPKDYPEIITNAATLTIPPFVLEPDLTETSLQSAVLDSQVEEHNGHC